MEYTCISCDLIAWGTSLPKCSELLAPINTLCDSSRHMCTLLAKYMVPVFHILLKSSDDCKLSLDPAHRHSSKADRTRRQLAYYWYSVLLVHLKLESKGTQGREVAQIQSTNCASKWTQGREVSRLLPPQFHSHSYKALVCLPTAWFM